MASHLHTPPIPPSIEKGPSQQGLVRDERQSLAHLQVPHIQPLKRRSTNATRELLEPRKHPTGPAMDFGKHKIMIEPGGDEDGIDFEDVHEAMARMKLERIERGIIKRYVRNEIEVAKPSNGCLCLLCGDSIRWEGRCKKCISEWLEDILPSVERDNYEYTKLAFEKSGVVLGKIGA